MQLKREIEVIQKGIMTAPLDVTYGTDLLKVALIVKDYKIPKRATAIVYSSPIGKAPKKVIADIADNSVIFTPEKGLFEVGKNELQVRVVCEEKSLFGFILEVNCQKSFKDDDAEEIKEQPTLVEQLVAKLQDRTYNGIFTGAIAQSQEGTLNVEKYNAIDGTRLVPNDSIVDKNGDVFLVIKTGEKVEAQKTGICIKGERGKSAYEYAKEGGYIGTEEEFKEKIANNTTDITYNPDTKTLSISSKQGN